MRLPPLMVVFASGAFAVMGIDILSTAGMCQYQRMQTPMPQSHRRQEMALRGCLYPDG